MQNGLEFLVLQLDLPAEPVEVENTLSRDLGGKIRENKPVARGFERTSIDLGVPMPAADGQNSLAGFLGEWFALANRDEPAHDRFSVGSAKLHRVFAGSCLRHASQRSQKVPRLTFEGFERKILPSEG